MILEFWPYNLSQLFSLTKVRMVGYLAESRSSGFAKAKFSIFKKLFSTGIFKYQYQF